MIRILTTMVKGFLLSLMVLGVFAVAANAQSGDTREIAFKIDKRKIKFTTSAFKVPAGKLVIGGEIRDVDVSGGGGGCFTLTVNTYKLAPNGERILVRSRSRQICKTERLPEIVIDRVPQGKYLVELVIDRPLIGEETLEGKLTVAVESEKINLR